MKLFISGISGLLGLNLALQCKDGWDVSGCYNRHPVSIPGVEAAPLDLVSLDATLQALGKIRPDIILHTVALTDVDTCEADPESAFQLNVLSTQNIATAAKSLGAKLVHISTDQVFDGTKAFYGEQDPALPINNYGHSKLRAEQSLLETMPQALIVRTNFYGWGPPHRRSFSDWILDGLEKGAELTLFADVFFSPILINQLQDPIISLAGAGASGVFHVAGSERISKYELGLQLAQKFGYSTANIRPISVDDFQFNARRPKDMSLDYGKAEAYLQSRLPTVEEGLEELHRLRSNNWPQELQNAMGSGVPT